MQEATWLKALIGRWRGEGVDVAPAPEGDTRTPFVDEIVFHEVGEVENARRQRLFAVGYHQVVRRKDTGEAFHDQMGHLAWEIGTRRVVHALTIPRGLALVAEGEVSFASEGWTITLSAQADAIAQTRFLTEHARTLGFAQRIVLQGPVLSYEQTTKLEIYGRRVAHTDAAQLKRVGT